MQNTTSYEFGDIVLVGFPFTNLKTTKKRPAVVLSQELYQHYRPDVILMAITSQVRNPLSFGEILVRDWKEAGLLKPSVMKPLIATVEQNIILRRLGRFEVVDKAALQALMREILV